MKKVRRNLPRRSYDYGDVLLAYHAVRDLRLAEDLGNRLPTEKSKGGNR